MKKNGFTILELLVVIAIIGFTVTLITIKVVKNIQDSKKLVNNNIKEIIENAAYVYATTHEDEFQNLNSIGVDYVSINNLILRGLLTEKNIGEEPVSNNVLIANINGEIKTSYNSTNNLNNVIFINGLKEISIKKDSTYNDLGAYVAIINEGIFEFPLEHTVSTVNTSIVGTYKVTYTYTNAEEVERIVKVIN